jgi:AraC-like DNA-binding protein
MNCDSNSRAAASDYREYAPPPGLADRVLCFWTQSITGDGQYAQRVLPDGCIDILFVNDRPPVVVGPWVEPFIAQFPFGTNILGARWRPGCAPALLGVPATELLNQQVELRDICSRSLSSSLERVSEKPNLDTRRSAFEAALLTLLPCVESSDRMLNASIQWLVRHPNGRIEKLSRLTGVSSRQLQRRFSAAVGYGPKAFQSIVRFQRVLHLAGGPIRRRSLVDLAASAGYADQAHMTREIHRFSGCRPTVLLESARCALQMSDFFQGATDDLGYTAGCEERSSTNRRAP